MFFALLFQAKALCLAIWTWLKWEQPTLAIHSSKAAGDWLAHYLLPHNWVICNQRTKWEIIVRHLTSQTLEPSNESTWRQSKRNSWSNKWRGISNEEKNWFHQIFVLFWELNSLNRHRLFWLDRHRLFLSPFWDGRVPEIIRCRNFDAIWRPRRRRRRHWIRRRSPWCYCVLSRMI